ncbi:MAG: hypothetical protein ABIJ31_02050 [Pseudomonadota bacterium]
MKKTIATITAVFIAIVFSSVPAHADRKTMEGFLLGTGVAILGTAIIQGMNKDSNTPQHQSSYSHDRKNNHADFEYRGKRRTPARYYSRGPVGHWEIERIWIEPVYETKWNPGHYNQHGEWVNGRHEQFEIFKGYWQEEKRWVRH